MAGNENDRVFERVYCWWGEVLKCNLFFNIVCYEVSQMQIGSVGKGFVLRVGFLNPSFIKYQNFGKVKMLALFGLVKIFWGRVPHNPPIKTDLL